MFYIYELIIYYILIVGMIGGLCSLMDDNNKEDNNKED